MKIKKPEAEVTIAREEIESISFVQVVDPVAQESSKSVSNTPVPGSEFKQPNEVKKKSPTNFTNKKSNQFDNKQQPKTTKPIPIRRNVGNGNGNSNGSCSNYNGQMSTSAPHLMKSEHLKRHNSNNNNSNNNNNNNKKRNKNYDLMQPDDFSDQGDFDFESSNAMFDKKSIFQEIEASIFGKNPEKPDLVRQIGRTEEKYRHDENVLDSMCVQFRNIQLEFSPKQEYLTDDNVCLPTISRELRQRIQTLAIAHGYSQERQNDCLARGVTELALQLLGGSRRLSPKNLHQWPRVTIICDAPNNFWLSEVGLSTGRQLASHGVNVMVYVKTSSTLENGSKELELYTATGNDFTCNVKDLPPCDLIILAVVQSEQTKDIVQYIHNNRSQVMAIDPPTKGFLPFIPIRSVVYPILPLDNIHTDMGKVHLVNMSISDKFFKDAGIKYFPVFSGKNMIPLHLK